MRLLGSFFHIAMNGMAASEKIFRLLDLPEPADKSEMLNGSYHIECENVSFSYEKDREILHGIQMTFEEKQFTAIVGESGSGKSTISSILMGRNQSYSGSVTIGGKELKALNEADLMAAYHLYGTLPKIESAEMMFSASRSRRLQIVPVIQSFAQLEKNYGKEGAEIIVDNTQLTIFGGFAPNSSSAEVLSKALGSRTVMSGSVSRGKNDPSQSLQMMERALMTPDELKSMPKGQFIVMKTGFYPMKVRLKLFFKWGIQFEEEYAVEEKGNRKVSYAEKQEILDGIVKKYHPEWLMENAPPAEAIPPAGGQTQAMTERNEPSSREKRKGGGTGLRTAPRAARPERKAEEGIQESRMLHPTKSTEVKEDG